MSAIDAIYQLRLVAARLTSPSPGAGVLLRQRLSSTYVLERQPPMTEHNTTEQHSAHLTGEESNPHSGHGWMMLMCVPMIAIAVALFLTGAVGGGAVVAALLCAAMMAMMMSMPGGHRHH